MSLAFCFGSILHFLTLGSCRFVFAHPYHHHSLFLTLLHSVSHFVPRSHSRTCSAFCFNIALPLPHSLTLSRFIALAFFHSLALSLSYSLPRSLALPSFSLYSRTISCSRSLVISLSHICTLSLSHSPTLSLSHSLSPSLSDTFALSFPQGVHSRLFRWLYYSKRSD